MKSCCVLTLSDIGRSPRMQYHSLSLAEAGFKVHLVGFMSSDPFAEVLKSTNITIHPLKEPVKYTLSKGPLFPIKASIKLLSYCLPLIITLLRISFDFCLVQTPPAIPVLFIARVICWLKRSRMIIDWHNFGYTLMELRLGNHWAVRLSRRYEIFCSRLTRWHVCVSWAMKRFLINEFQVKGDVLVLYDKPGPDFVVLSEREKISKLKQLWKLDPKICSAFGRNPFLRGGYLKPSRPALVVTSTSWTPDENIDILLEALELVDKQVKIVCLITGKGPMKGHYEDHVLPELNSRLKNCSVSTAWLDPRDYPVLLGCADLGISLHYSSSGLDLPMKVLDMFGAGLPVCAVMFDQGRTLEELIVDKVNGLMFRDSFELRDCLLRLLGKFPSVKEELDSLKDNIIEEFSMLNRWNVNWESIMLPFIESMDDTELTKMIRKED